MASLPESVIIREDGPREGFQMLPDFVPTEQKLELIRALTGTGVTSIEVTSFVRPDRVPQHADAEAVARGLPSGTGVRFRALYLNKKGFLRAAEFPALELEGYILLAASESFLQKNNNQTLDDAIAGIDDWLVFFAEQNVAVERVMLSTAFGDVDSGLI
ncbi:MAG: hypothetical protein KDD44_01115, partial [Bdellovibrionales bacterium]|nr:hypothetical protein [Bdellovibrionales bacterium]